MSGHLRFCFASLVLVGAVSAAPASANPITDLFNTGPREPAATSPVQPECLLRPGNSSGPRQRWVYRRDGHRKCWFLAEGIAVVRKSVRDRAAKGGASPDRNEAGRHRQGPVIDARAELLRSAPAEGTSATPPALELKVADAASELSTRAAPTWVASIAELAAPEHSVPGQADVKQPLAAGPIADAGPSSDPPAIAISVVEEERSSALPWLGVLLMALGGLSVLSSSRTLRDAVRLRPPRVRYAGHVT
ncbi:hypothetical protein AB7M16_007494 [Bradyrhizobium sp. USDA 372]